MPPALESGDRKILLFGGGILLLLLVLTLVLGPAANNSEGPGSPTTYSTAARGTQAAYLLLSELGFQSERWEKPPSELPSNADGKILILAEPPSFPDKAERSALLQFARAGGWILYAGESPFLFLETGGVAPPKNAPPLSLIEKTFPAIAPSPFTRHASEITMSASNRWLFSEGVQVPLYGEPEEPVVVTWRLGKGRILWWAAPTPITNSGISKTGNMAFFLDCVQAARPGSRANETTVLWDEYFHGYRGSLWSYFAETPVPWAVFQLGLTALFVLFTFGRRNGPLFSPAPLSRLSPLEFVDTLGDLYRRANAGPSAVHVAYLRLRTRLLRRLSLAPSTTNLQLDHAVRERLGWKQPGFFDTLQRAEKAGSASDLAGADALKIVQALEHYEVLLGLKTRANGEKP